MFVHSQMTYVSLAHRYWNSLWTPEENRKVYGDWSSIQGVGSNLKLVLAVQSPGPIPENAETALQALKRSADHRCLFTDVADFASRPSTLETITLWLVSQVVQIPLEFLAYLEVHESEKLKCRYRWDTREVRLTQKVGNLHLTVSGQVDSQTGLLFSRERLSTAVAEVFPQFSEPFETTEGWLKKLFGELHRRIPQLCELRVDLGGQKALRHSVNNGILDR